MEHDPLKLALDWHRAGRGAAIATVMETWGSAPRRPGAMLVISGDGEMEGSVSGGCVEGAVALEAEEAIRTGEATVLDYGVADDDAFAVGLACGGEIKVLLEPVQAMGEERLATLVAARAAPEAAAYVVEPESWTRSVVRPGARADVDVRFRSDRTGVEEGAFIAVHNPPLRMAIVGAVHIAQPLVAMAKLAGFAPTVIDPRAAFASDARFPDTALMHDWPDAAMAAFDPGPRAAVVTLTHDPKLDDPALEVALRSDAFYIGALGSKRTHAKRCERFRATGHSEDAIARIHAPVGLDIGGATPGEIAVSILAEVIARLRGKDI